MHDAAPLSKTAKVAAEALLAGIDKQKLRATEAFYEIGGALRQLLEQKLYGALGFASFEELLVERHVMDATQAKKLIEVHRKFSRARALAIGPEKAYALARYAARTKADDTPEEFVERGFPIAGRRKPVNEVSVRAVLEATRTAVARQKGSRGESERARKDAETELRFVKKILHKHEVEGLVGLSFRRGSWHLRIEIPAARARSVLKPDR